MRRSAAEFQNAFILALALVFELRRILRRTDKRADTHVRVQQGRDENSPRHNQLDESKTDQICGYV